MPAETLAPIPLEDGASTVVWSRQPQPDADLVLYFNHYTFDAKLHRRICPKARKALYMYEPVAVDPVQYTQSVWAEFDWILTWNTYLADHGAPFVHQAGIYYDLPYCRDYGCTPTSAPPNLDDRDRAIVQICGDKYSLTAEELYSARRSAARWFAKRGRTRMDVFGKPAMKVPNYRGVADDKQLTLSKYRYALCFENTYHPLWTRGYLTEKILDCMASGTVPVYYGCSNIQDLVPAECFIDYRSFDSLDDLDVYLQGLSDRDYLQAASAMAEFIHTYQPQHKHACQRLYEQLLELGARESVRIEAKSYPDDYLDQSGGVATARFYLMKWLLPHHQLAYNFFSVLRKISS